MGPGREMDRLVAQHVMGWKFDVPANRGGECQNCGGRWGDAPSHGRRKPLDNEWYRWCDGNACHYSTSDAAAWLVLRAMLEKEIDVDIDRATPLQVSVTFWPSGCYDYAVSGEAETFAEAVCVAALRAMGVTLEAGDETRT